MLVPTLETTVREWFVTCGNLECSVLACRTRRYYTEAEAIAAWNSRAERTCKMEPTFINPQAFENVQEFTCTACWRFAIVEQLGDDEDRPNYCPNCGAKVVDE